ncbi:DUF2567 domain-containing protein [Modestobacter roseus]|uniref:DUF2567 domain-containing protein n=1 Tax=Modestobacter roseus TaxID=1181884 RepID=UPI0034DE51B2
MSASTPPSSWAPPAGSGAWLPARRSGVPGLRDSRADLPAALIAAGVLTLAGLLVGGAWLWLAPRADFRVTETDVVPVGAAPSNELFVADDGVLVLLLAGLGLVAGVAGWLWRRRRGAMLLAGLSTGALAAGVVAWQLGEWLAPGPTEEELGRVGATVTTGLDLGATAALAVGPFVAVLAYLVATALTARDDLGRDEPVAQLPPEGRPPLPPVPPPRPRS